jgi:endonuclease-3
MKTATEARALLLALEGQHPNADTELRYANPFELLVATILSAQTTDAGVNQATPSLFARYPDAPAMAAADVVDVEQLVRTTGFFRQKARALIRMAQGLVDRHAGQVPGTMEALVALPGVGRKTANVVLGHALGVPGLPVDRHVLRVANRIGLARSQDPEVVEQQLGALLPPQAWTVASDTFILHGRRICKPKPLCDRCAVRVDCDYFRNLGAAAPTKSPAARSTRAARPRSRRP